jgi:hypothetical protein
MPDKPQSVKAAAPEYERTRMRMFNIPTLAATAAAVAILAGGFMFLQAGGNPEIAEVTPGASGDISDPDVTDASSDPDETSAPTATQSPAGDSGDIATEPPFFAQEPYVPPTPGVDVISEKEAIEIVREMRGPHWNEMFTAALLDDELLDYPVWFVLSTYELVYGFDDNGHFAGGGAGHYLNARTGEEVAYNDPNLETMWQIVLNLFPQTLRNTCVSTLTAASDFIFPTATGHITRPFAESVGHWGIDIAVPPGTEVFAAAAGTVVLSQYNYSSLGHTVIILHDCGRLTVYAHNSALSVEEGDVAEQGQVIALSGATGRATGPHLHFEVWEAGRTHRINPMNFFE